jgi:hypothetical protein
LEQAKSVPADVEYAADAYGCVGGADALVIVTEWALDLARIKTKLRSPLIVDLRNIYRPDEMRRCGFTYVSVGRKCGNRLSSQQRPQLSGIVNTRRARRAADARAE